MFIFNLKDHWFTYIFSIWGVFFYLGIFSFVFFICGSVSLFHVFNLRATVFQVFNLRAASLHQCETKCVFSTLRCYFRQIISAWTNSTLGLFLSELPLSGMPLTSPLGWYVHTGWRMPSYTHTGWYFSTVARLSSWLH